MIHYKYKKSNIYISVYSILHLHLQLLNILTLPSENGKDLSITTPKGNSKHCYNTTILPDNLSHDLISIQTRPNHTPSEKQTDQLVINTLPNTSDDKASK